MGNEKKKNLKSIRWEKQIGRLFQSSLKMQIHLLHIDTTFFCIDRLGQSKEIFSMMSIGGKTTISEPRKERLMILNLEFGVSLSVTITLTISAIHKISKFDGEQYCVQGIYLPYFIIGPCIYEASASEYLSDCPEFAVAYSSSD